MNLRTLDFTGLLRGHPAKQMQRSPDASRRATPEHPAATAPHRRLKIGPEESAKRLAQIEAWSVGGIPVVRSPAAVIIQHPALLWRLALPGDRKRGPGHTYAPIVFLYLATYLRPGKGTLVWPSNETIARGTGLPIRSVERGIAYLKAISKISTTYGRRPGRRTRKPGRIIEMHLAGGGEVPKVIFPEPNVMRGIWARCAKHRTRPAALVALALAMFVIAAAEQRAEVVGSASVTMPISMFRGLVGAGHGSAFNRRLAELEHAKLISRIGEHWRHGAVVHRPKTSEGEANRQRLRLPQLLRWPEIPTSADLITLDDLQAMDEALATAMGWHPRDRIPGPASPSPRPYST